MPADAPIAMTNGDDLARAGHHGVGVQAVLQGADEVFPLQALASGGMARWRMRALA
jgi:hypothetical protein